MLEWCLFLKLALIADGRVCCAASVGRCGCRECTPGRWPNEGGLARTQALKEILIRVRVTELEHARIRRAAEREHLAMSTWARQALLDAVAEKEPARTGLSLRELIGAASETLGRKER